MTLDLLILFETFWIGFFYAFLSTYAIQILTSYLVHQSYLRYFIAISSLIIVQVIWALVALTMLSLCIWIFSPGFDLVALIGCILLFLLALKIYRGQFIYRQEEVKAHLSSVFKSIFFLLVTSPRFLIAYGGVFAALGLYKSSLNFTPVLGVFLGTLCFCLLFMPIVAHFKKWSTVKLIQYFHKLSALVLITSALIGILRIYF